MTADQTFVVKEADGQFYWVLISSNSYQDRDGEIVTQKALEADVARADSDGDYGPLLWWHEKSIVLGQCTGNAMHDRMLIEWGTFKSADIAEAFKQAAPALGVSIGFQHPVTQPDRDGLFHSIRRFERSALPRDVASNPLTAVPLVERESVMLKEKVEALRKVFGGDEALVNSVITMADSQQKAADAAGVRTKEKKECEPGYHWDEETQACVKDAPAEEAPAADKKEFVGDMQPATLKALIAEAVAGPVEALRAEFAQKLAEQQTTKAASEQATAEALKGYNDKLDTIAQSATEALKGVQELKGELPRALGERLKGYHPSQEGADPPEHLKQAMPAPDPMAAHWNALKAISGNGQTPSA